MLEIHPPYGQNTFRGTIVGSRERQTDRNRGKEREREKQRGQESENEKCGRRQRLVKKERGLDRGTGCAKHAKRCLRANVKQFQQYFTTR